MHTGTGIRLGTSAGLMYVSTGTVLSTINYPKAILN
jgi:hypothetical protein